MFVGYEIKTQQNQAKPVILETDIKLSQAVLDPSKGGKKEPVCLMVEYNKKQFIIAVLDPSRTWQCPLDLMFSAGSEVKFFVRGSGTVHLTGFEYRDDMDDQLAMDMSSDEEEEDEDDDEEDEDNEKVDAAKAVVKKQMIKGAKTNGVSHKNSKKEDLKKLAGDINEDDDDDSDDEDFDSDAMDQDDDMDMFEDSDDDDEEDLDDEDESEEEDDD